MHAVSLPISLSLSLSLDNCHFSHTHTHTHTLTWVSSLTPCPVTHGYSLHVSNCGRENAPRVPPPSTVVTASEPVKPLSRDPLASGRPGQRILWQKAGKKRGREKGMGGERIGGKGERRKEERKRKEEAKTTALRESNSL